MRSTSKQAGAWAARVLPTAADRLAHDRKLHRHLRNASGPAARLAYAFLPRRGALRLVPTVGTAQAKKDLAQVLTELRGAASRASSGPSHLFPVRARAARPSSLRPAYFPESADLFPRMTPSGRSCTLEAWSQSRSTSTS